VKNKVLARLLIFPGEDSLDLKAAFLFVLDNGTFVPPKTQGNFKTLVIDRVSGVFKLEF